VIGELVDGERILEHIKAPPDSLAVAWRHIDKLTSDTPIGLIDEFGFDLNGIWFGWKIDAGLDQLPHFQFLVRAQLEKKASQADIGYRAGTGDPADDNVTMEIQSWMQPLFNPDFDVFSARIRHSFHAVLILSVARLH